MPFYEDNQKTLDDMPPSEKSSSPNSKMIVSPKQEQTDEQQEADCPKDSEVAKVATDEKTKDDSIKTEKNEDENADGVIGAGDMAKRFLPAYKKANAALTFPEKVS